MVALKAMVCEGLAVVLKSWVVFATYLWPLVKSGLFLHSVIASTSLDQWQREFR